MTTLYYESRFGLARGTVFHNGRPHLYAEGLESDPSLIRSGVRSVARVSGFAGSLYFLTLADGSEAIFDSDQKLTEGAVVEIDIAAEARGDKRARARLIGPAEGQPRRIGHVVPLKDRLIARAEALFCTVDVSEDSDKLDDALAEALNPSGPLPDRGFLSVERTRALIACDVDSGGGEGQPAGRAVAKSVNLAACADLGRRLRLSGLAGLVVVDLIGRRFDAGALTKTLLTGFGPEASSIATAPAGRFGTLEFTRPWGETPMLDQSTQPLHQAGKLLRAAVRHADGEPGRQVLLRAPSPVLDIVKPLLAKSYDPLAAILRLEVAPRPEVLSL